MEQEKQQSRKTRRALYLMADGNEMKLHNALLQKRGQYQ